jgi:hypothetical protein
MKIYVVALNSPTNPKTQWFYSEAWRDAYVVQCGKAGDTLFEIDVAETEKHRTITALVELEAARHYAAPQP